MEWKQYPKEPKYSVSTTGQVKNINGLQLKSRINRSGYYALTIVCGKKAKTIPIHRLVAETFIPNPEEKKTVNHINGVKHDNNISNLEWATYRENYSHASKVLRVGMHGSIVDKMVLNKLQYLIGTLEDVKKRPECTRAMEEFINRALRRTRDH